MSYEFLEIKLKLSEKYSKSIASSYFINKITSSTREQETKNSVLNSATFINWIGKSVGGDDASV